MLISRADKVLMVVQLLDTVLTSSIPTQLAPGTSNPLKCLLYSLRATPTLGSPGSPLEDLSFLGIVASQIDLSTLI